MAYLTEQPRPRRRIHWQTPITLAILLGVLGGGAWWGWSSLTESTAEPQCVDTPLPNGSLTPKQVVVNVYNGGARSGRAAETAAVLKKRGFLIGKVANEPAGVKVPVVAIRGAEATAPEVRLIYLQLNERPSVVADHRTDHAVDLVIGPKFTKPNLGKVKSVPVPGGTACIPVRRTEVPIPSGQAPS